MLSTFVRVGQDFRVDGVDFQARIHPSHLARGAQRLYERGRHRREHRSRALAGLVDVLRLRHLLQHRLDPRRQVELLLLLPLRRRRRAGAPCVSRRVRGVLCEEEGTVQPSSR